MRSMASKGNVVELIAAEIIGVNIAVIILAFAVDQYQRVVAAHATHGYAALPLFYRAFPDINAF